VKAIDTIRIALPSIPTTISSTVSSDGIVNVYDLSLLPPSSPTETTDIPDISPVATYDSKGSRLTCVTLADDEMGQLEQPPPEEGEKRKRESDSGTEEEEEDEWPGLS
jgi:protein MAK11